MTSSRRAALSAVALLLSLAAPSLAGASARVASGCKSKSTFRVPGGGSFSAGGESGEEHTYICANAGGRTVEIGEAGNPEASSEGGEGPNVQRLAIAGEIAGVAYFNENGSGELQVFDLRSGRARFTRKLGGGGGTVQGGEPVQGHSVGAIVVRRDASAAWTEQQTGGGYEVIEHDAHGTTVLDDTRTTRPYSLKLNGSTLHWLEHGGEARTATLD